MAKMFVVLLYGKNLDYCNKMTACSMIDASQKSSQVSDFGPHESLAVTSTRILFYIFACSKSV